jgi:hypothetical protein
MTPSNHNRMMFATFSQTPGSCKHRSSSRWPTIPLLISDRGIHDDRAGSGYTRRHECRFTPS